MKTGGNNGGVHAVTWVLLLITVGMIQTRNTRWNAQCVAERLDTESVECVLVASKCGMDKKTIFLEVFRGYPYPSWAERHFTTIKAFKEEYDYNYVFMGKTAIVYIGTKDYEIDREQALKIATDHVKGNVHVINIDLALCGGLPPRLRKNSAP